MVEAPAYLLGIDAGNTVIKAVLFDLQGRQVAQRALQGRSCSPHPGHVERDPEELWSDACAVIRGCVADAGVAPEQIAGIGCAGHGNGLYLLDADRRPLVGIQSLDTRADRLARELSARCGSELHARCLQRPWPAQTAVVLAWIKSERPELYRAAHTVALCKDFITHKLTGELVSEISDMSAGGLLRMPACAYDDALLELHGLGDARAKLPRLIGPTDIAGRVTARAGCGLAEDTPVIGGFLDVVASALGSGVSRPGQASIVLGTWSINQVQSDAPLPSPDLFMVVGFGPGRYMNIEASATSAANLEWYVREFVARGVRRDNPFELANARVAEVRPKRDDPFFHPFLFGSGQGAEFRAGFYGLAGRHGEGHLLRALFEGVVFEHRRHVEVLSAAGATVDRAVLSGGGSRSPIWPQMMADVLGVPIVVTECAETGALGAAIGAGVATGFFADYEAGIAAMTRVRQVFEPDTAMRAHYDDRYRTYLSLIETMREFWAAQYQLASSDPDPANPDPAFGRT